ncbi:hypothetical protein [Roseiarcus sp.]|uniref:hypothetical protein n=1 Tax=Roseiarcus sp. TaxID=1969460 RepID=UPI003F9D5AAC
MKRSNTFALAFAVSLASPTAAYAAEESATAVHRDHQSVHHRPVTTQKAVPAGSTAQSAPALAKPMTPPAVQNDSDGLSRDPEDCMMGCLDTTF